MVRVSKHRRVEQHDACPQLLVLAAFGISFAVGTCRTSLLGSRRLISSGSFKTVRIVLPSLVADALWPRSSSALNSACSSRNARGMISFDTLMFGRGSLLSPYLTSPRFWAAQYSLVYAIAVCLTRRPSVTVIWFSGCISNAISG